MRPIFAGLFFLTSVNHQRNRTKQNIAYSDTHWVSRSREVDYPEQSLNCNIHDALIYGILVSSNLLDGFGFSGDDNAYEPKLFAATTWDNIYQSAKDNVAEDALHTIRGIFFARNTEIRPNEAAGLLHDLWKNSPFYLHR